MTKWYANDDHYLWNAIWEYIFSQFKLAVKNSALLFFFEPSDMTAIPPLLVFVHDVMIDLFPGNIYAF